MELSSFLRGPLFQRRELLVLGYFTIVSFLVTRSAWLEQGVITFEDYVPFSSIEQLWQYVSHTEWNLYLNMPIFRDYSFFFIWARLSDLTIFSLTILTIFSGLLMFLSIRKLLLHVFNGKDSVSDHYITMASTASATFALLVCLFTKLNNFYSLVVGMALFSFCLSSSLDFILKNSERKLDFVVFSLFVSILLWIMPAPHFIYFFYIGLFAFSFIYYIVDKKAKSLWLFIVLVFLHLIPYSVFIAGALSYGNLSEIFPTTYSLISGGGVKPLVFFSSFQTSIVELFIYGSYGPRIAPLPMAISILLSVLALSVILVRKSRITMFLCILYLLSFFFAIGVYSPFLGTSILLRLYEIDVLRGIVELILQVLRQPHRWQFLELYAKMNLMAASYVIVCKASCERISKFRKRSTYFTFDKINSEFPSKHLIAIAMSILFISPFFLSPYNTVFSGNFGGVIVSTEVQELNDIKQMIAQKESNSSKLMSFTGFSMFFQVNGETSIVQEGFYPFYLDCASIKWQSSTTPDNMLYGSFGYYNALVGNDVSRYLALQNVRWVLFRDSIKEYFADEADRILSTLLSDEGLSLVYHKNDYYLFENEYATLQSVVESRSMTFAVAPCWTPMRLLNEYFMLPNDTVFIDIMDGKIGFTSFEQYSSMLGKHLVIWYYPPMHNETDMVLSLLLREKGVYCTPRKLLSLEEEGWLSNNQINSWSKTTLSSLQGGVFGHYGATDGKYIIGTAQGLGVTFGLDVENVGSYNIFLKVAAPEGAKINSKIEDVEKTLEIPKISGNYKFVEIFSGLLDPGHYDITLKKADENPVSLNLVYAIENEILATTIEKFKTLISSNDNRIMHSCQELAEHCDDLDYPADYEILYSPSMTYSDTALFEVEGSSYQPLQTWYCGSALVTPKMVDYLHSILIMYGKTRGYYPYGVLFVFCYVISLSFILIRKSSLKTSAKTSFLLRW